METESAGNPSFWDREIQQTRGGRMVRVMTVFAVLLAIAGGQTERWVYRYDGPGNSGGMANSLVAGGDGNVYAAGASASLVSRFTVISLTPSGGERWVYTYDNPRSSNDGARSIVAGADGNIYAAGLSNDMGKHFTVISLTPSDSERWVYRYPAESWANSVAVGTDGNIYAAGLDGNDDFLVVSLTPSGGERWAYRYESAGLSNSEALSLVTGADGNIYAAGWRADTMPGIDFMVISLTGSGAERWVYRYDGPGNSAGCANTMIAGADGNVYAAGASTDSGADLDFTVISLTPSGSERWAYRYDGPGNSSDGTYSLVEGTGGNIYAAGVSAGSFDDFTVISLTSGGAERWVYRYNGPGNYVDEAISLVAGPGGNIYAAGSCTGSVGYFDFTVISLTSGGAERWVYSYDGPGNSDDYASSLVAGTDGNIYAAGSSTGSDSTYDFTVISLTSGSGIAEAGPATINSAFGFAVGTIKNRALEYTLKLPKPATVSLSFCDLQGRKLASWQVTVSRGSSQHTRNLPDLGSGVYFLAAEVPGEGLRENRKLIVAR
jgi:hypothetical protein